MQEYVSRAVVLEYVPLGDLDGRFSLYTERYGKLRARATSVRKITSKLAGHLQPGMLTAIRIVEQNSFQLVDALKEGMVSATPIALEQVSRIVPEAEPDPELWDALTAPVFSWNAVLRALGWDPNHAACARCGARAPRVFLTATQEFFCETHASKARNNAVLYLY